jgi:hypothetical protein
VTEATLVAGPVTGPAQPSRILLFGLGAAACSAASPHTKTGDAGQQEAAQALNGAADGE